VDIHQTVAINDGADNPVHIEVIDVVGQRLNHLGGDVVVGDDASSHRLSSLHLAHQHPRGDLGWTAHSDLWAVSPYLSWWAMSRRSSSAFSASRSATASPRLRPNAER